VRRRIWNVVFLCVTVTSVAHTADLDSLKQTYETEAQRIREDHDKNLNRLLDAYGKSLENAIPLLRKEGDPEPVLAASAEKMRFDRDRTVPNPAADDAPKLLQDVQAKYNEAVQVAENEKDKRFAALAERYVAALGRLMKQHTNDDKLDLAMNVKTEKQRVEFVLADVESRLKAVGDQKKVETTRAALEGRKTRLPTEAKDAVSFNEHHYKFFAENISWHEAKKRCEELGGHLAIVTSKEENDFVTSITRGPGVHVWLGATDEKREGTWVWVNGEQMTYASWFYGRPNIRAGNYLYTSSTAYGRPGLWNDKTPGADKNLAGYVCEWDF
jgi:hypothetical protein